MPHILLLNCMGVIFVPKLYSPSQAAKAADKVEVLFLLVDKYDHILCMAVSVRLISLLPVVEQLPLFNAITAIDTRDGDGRFTGE